MSQNGKYVMQGIHSLKMTRNLSAAIRKIYSKKNYESEQKAVIQLAALSDIR